MKKLSTVVISLFLAVPAFSTPYFRLIDPAHPQPVVGALVDPVHLGNTSAASLLPLVTHSTKDGCLLPSVVCEDWSPLAVGGSMNAGKLTFDVGPIANVLPWMKSAGQAVIPSGWTALRSIVDYDASGDAVTFSAGPVFEYSQLQNKGFFKVFTGVALHF